MKKITLLTPVLALFLAVALVVPANAGLVTGFTTTNPTEFNDWKDNNLIPLQIVDWAGVANSPNASFSFTGAGGSTTATVSVNGDNGNGSLSPAGPFATASFSNSLTFLFDAPLNAFTFALWNTSAPVTGNEFVVPWLVAGADLGVWSNWTTANVFSEDIPSWETLFVSLHTPAFATGSVIQGVRLLRQGDVTDHSFSVQVSGTETNIVPAPATIAMIGLAGIGGLIMRTRRKHTS